MQPSTMSLAILRLLLSYSVQNLIFVFIRRDLLPLNIPCTKHNIKAAYLTFNLEIKAKQNSTSRWKYQNPLWNTLFLSFYLYTEAFDSLEHWLLLRSNCTAQISWFRISQKHPAYPIRIVPPNSWKSPFLPPLPLK